MRKYEYKGQLYTVNELSEMSGIAPANIRYRLRCGYPIDEAIKAVATNESVREFVGASYWEDWVGMPISGLFEIYWGWCIQNGYTPLHIQAFSRQLFAMYPNLKTVPIKTRNGCHRVIRER